MSQVTRIDYINNLYTKAYWCKASIDKPMGCFQGDAKSLALKEYKKFLQEMVNNPVASKIAMRDTLREHPLEYPQDSFFNAKELENSPKVSVLLKRIKEINASQSGTRQIRNDIINSERISLHTVIPKLKGAKKFLKKLKFMF